MPPQHGKSELTSRRFPAYMLGLHPDKKIIGTSYNQTLATKFNRSVQRVIDDPSYREVFPGTRLSGKGVSSDDGSVRNANEFEVVGFDGFYRSAGIDSGVSGTPADILVIDDPIKGRAEANSATVRNNIWERYTDDFLTRLSNNGQILLVMTRWHEDDLAGRLLKKEPENWDVVTFEAIKRKINHPKDPRKYGEALWPEQHSEEKILEVENLNASTFEALYQQDPQPIDGDRYAHGFHEVGIVKPTEYLDYLPIHYTLDFNVAPYMTGICGQLERLETWNGFENPLHLRIFREYPLEHPRNNAEGLGEALAEDFEGDLINGFYLYGDASGNNRVGLRNTKTLFEGVAKGLDYYNDFCEKRVPSSNPKYRAIAKGAMGRREFLNKLLSGQLPCKVSIDPSCEKLIGDLRGCLADANGKLNKAKNSKGVEELGHMIDAFQYLICHPKFLGWLAKL